MWLFLVNSTLLGVGLAMDAFTVSLADGLSEADITRGKQCGIAGIFAFFQALMPMVGWVCIRTVVERFTAFEKFIPWIAFLLLAFIGGNMLTDGIKHPDSDETKNRLTVPVLFVQGVATSIDALSVGFTIADYGLRDALSCALIIAAVTFVICMAGVSIGKRFGTALSSKAQILGGVILIGIGIELLIKGLI